MPQFNADAVTRISATVRRSEHNDQSRGTIRRDGQPDLVWHQLIDNFGVEIDDLATGKPGAWKPDENDGDGEYQADYVIIHDIRDPHGNSGAKAGDWVLCRPIGTTNGVVWEVMTRPTATGTVFGKLDYGLDYDDTNGQQFSIWTSNGLGVFVDSGENLPNVLPPPMMLSGRLSAGVFCKVEQNDGAWYVTAMSCEVIEEEA